MSPDIYFRVLVKMLIMLIKLIWMKSLGWELACLSYVIFGDPLFSLLPITVALYQTFLKFHCLILLNVNPHLLEYRRTVCQYNECFRAQLQKQFQPGRVWRQRLHSLFLEISDYFLHQFPCLLLLTCVVLVEGNFQFLVNNAASLPCL